MRADWLNQVRAALPGALPGAATLTLASLLVFTSPAAAREGGAAPVPPSTERAGDVSARQAPRPDTAQRGGAATPQACEAMTAQRMRAVVQRLDPEARLRGTVWEFAVEGETMALVFDPNADRMRLMLAVERAAAIPPATMSRLLQANFDTTLDARYAIARDTLWATYVHPLASLTERQLLRAIAQTVNLRKSYGTTFSADIGSQHAP